MLFRSSDKVAWADGRRRVALDVEVPVQPGVNVYRVVAEDHDGLRTTREVYVLGDDPGPAVSGE